MKLMVSNSNLNKFYLFLLILVFSLIVFKIRFSAFPTQDSFESVLKVSQLEYFQDRTGEMTLEEILKVDSGAYAKKEGNSVSFGKNRFAYWTRIDTDFLRTYEKTLYLSISNTTLEQIVVYLPYETLNVHTYESLKAGWGSSEAQTENFIYPVFKIDQKLRDHQYIYIRTASPFVQSYCFSVLTDHQLNQLRNKLLSSIGLFLGMFFFLIVSNLIRYFRLKENIYTYYVLYATAILAYHCILLGVFNLWDTSFSDRIIDNIVPMGLLMLSTAYLFQLNFLDIRKNLPKYYPYYGAGIFLSIGIAGMDLAGFKHEASIISSYVGLMLAVLGSFVALSAIRNQTPQAKYYLAGWIAMFCGIIIFILRGWGIIPNNEFSLFALPVTATIEAFVFSTALVDRIHLLKVEKEVAEEISASNEYAFLQAQIKPHFLYNALNVIAALCRIDAEKARLLVLDLSSYLRHSFDFRNLSKYVTFEEELAFVKAYVKIEQARFKDKLSVVYEIENAETLKLPPLLLQPLVENAIQHGIRGRAGGGTVVLSVKAREDAYVISVEDNGVGMTEEELRQAVSCRIIEGGSVGLANIQKRLEMLYGTKLSIESRLGSGTKILIYLPRGKDEPI